MPRTQGRPDMTAGSTVIRAKSFIPAILTHSGPRGNSFSSLVNKKRAEVSLRAPFSKSSSLFLFRGLFLFFEGGLGGGQAGDGDPEGRATDVGQADAMAEFDAGGLAPVFAADAEFDVGAGLASELDGDLHEFADASLVDGGKGVLFDNLQLLVFRKERAGVVAAHAQAGLGEVVGAKLKNCGSLAVWSATRAARGISIMVPTK